MIFQSNNEPFHLPNDKNYRQSGYFQNLRRVSDSSEKPANPWQWGEDLQRIARPAGTRPEMGIEQSMLTIGDKAKG